MKGYYLTGIIGGITLFIIMFIIGCTSSCITENKHIDISGDNAENKIILRYYMSDDYANSQVGFMYVEKGKAFIIDYIPTKEGYRFLGWYDSANLSTARQFADFNGYSLQSIQSDMILYPIFVKE